MEILKLRKNIPLKKKDISPIKKVCKVEETDEFFIFSDIENENLFLYNIAYLIVEYMYATSLKTSLLKEFPTSKTNEILKNHDKKTFEKAHLAFLLKTKLYIFLKNNEILNINSFLKFNSSIMFDEMEHIASLEIDTDGNFLLDEEDQEESSNNGDEYLKVITLSKYLEIGNYEKEDILDLHVFRNEKGQFRIHNEYNKNLKLDIDVSIKTLAEEIYQKEVTLDSKEYILTKFGVYLIFMKPERVILYASLEEDIDSFIRYFSYFKLNLNLETECFKSSEKKPS